ncbi:Arm DNA-binding domain-containing protein [Microcystis aeruginosa]|uniref:DUF3596 domain-containing protein n=1 Tax=Microcystis aeruginosa Ma_QC_C_20070703_M131 TaxID=2486263 RepID=A0A551YFE2_MICAE|nr:DUF3596 domain-containing protein [Microcystis aeruginosa]MDB9390539.1 DUF3596 domain-containing protein [Microcystis aeruginosa CS-579]TRT59667.1 MAG: DUF3596 domain-containing protein [Microcystis aeruginosa Ma_QC_C_20070703_M131]
MPPHTRKKAFKGTVSVEECQGRLRLRWGFEGKRYALSIGLPDSKVNRKVAQQKATMIELDMASGNFDQTLKKYKPHIQSTSQISVVILFGQFMDSKAKELLPRSLEKYRATITLTPKLEQILLARRPEYPNPDDLVFMSARGGAIDDHNFSPHSAPHIPHPSS